MGLVTDGAQASTVRVLRVGRDGVRLGAVRLEAVRLIDNVRR